MIFLRSIIFFTLLSFPNLIHGQNSTDQDEGDSDKLPQRPSWVIKTNPLSFLWGPIPFTSEYRLNLESIRSRYQSMEIGISYLAESPVLSSVINRFNSANASNFRKVDIQVRGARLQAAHKFYLKAVFDGIDPSMTLSDYAPNGYYLSPKVSMSYASFRSNNSMSPFMEMTHLNANLIFGRQMFFWGALAADIFIGAGYKRNIWEIRNPRRNLLNPDQRGLYGGNFRFVLGMNLGVYL